ARDRPRAPEERRGLQRARLAMSQASVVTLPAEMSAIIDTRTGESSRASLPMDYNKRLMLFSGRANPKLAVDIADKLGVDLGPVTLKTFSNGEVYCRYDESIRGADVFIVQSTCGNPQTGVTANDSLMELLFMIDAAVGASAHRVIAVTPWFGYSRQDKLNKKFASKVGAELAILDKERPAQQVAEIGYVIGDVSGKTAVIVDDMIDTAGTLKAAAKTVKEAGAARVYAAATHAVFSGD